MSMLRMVLLNKTAFPQTRTRHLLQLSGKGKFSAEACSYCAKVSRNMAAFVGTGLRLWGQACPRAAMGNASLCRATSVTVLRPDFPRVQCLLTSKDISRSQSQ